MCVSVVQLGMCIWTQKFCEIHFVGRGELFQDGCVLVFLGILVEVTKEDMMCIYVIVWKGTYVIDNGLCRSSGFWVLGGWSVDSCDDDGFLSFELAVDSDASSFDHL